MKGKTYCKKLLRYDRRVTQDAKRMLKDTPELRDRTKEDPTWKRGSFPKGGIQASLDKL